MDASDAASISFTGYELAAYESSRIRGEWTGKMSFYAFVFGITLFMSFFFVPLAFFGS